MCLDDIDHSFKEPVTTCEVVQDGTKHQNKRQFTNHANIKLLYEQQGQEDKRTGEATSCGHRKYTNDSIHSSARSFSPFGCLSPFDENAFVSAEQPIGEPEKTTSSYSNISFVEQNCRNDIMMSVWNGSASSLTTPVLESTEGFDYINIEACSGIIFGYTVIIGF